MFGLFVGDTNRFGIMRLDTPVSSRNIKLAILGIVVFAVLMEIASGGEVDRLAVGKAKFDMLCGVCHKDDHAAPLLAPPNFAVQRRYSMEFGNDKDAFIKAIAQWVVSPSEEKSLMVGAQKKFGLMLAMPYSEEDVKLAAGYLFDADLEMPVDCDPSMEVSGTEVGKSVGGG